MRNLKFILLFALLCTSSLVGWAASGIVKGKIVDSKTKESLEFVNVIIHDQGTKQYVKASITDQTGEFAISGLKDGAYTLTVSYIGYEKMETSFTISSSSDLDLKEISLVEDVQTLGEVQIVVERPQMRFELDKRVFNVNQSITSSGGSASDALSNIPSVEVDSEGEVSLRGNSAVTIWINGKESGLSAENRAEILQQLPAETIDRIEVITNPSARYSAEGTAGVINIILKENRNAGYYGSVQVGADSKGAYNASANINYNNGKLDAYASLGFRHREYENGGYSNRTDTGTARSTYLNQNTSGEGDGNSVFVRLGITYRLTRNDHFSLSGFGMFGSNNRSSTVDYRSDIPNSFYQSRRINSSDNDLILGNVQLGYKRIFSESSNLDFTVTYNPFKLEGTSVFNQISLFANGNETKSYQKQLSNPKNPSWEFQLDYTNTINENHKIEAGYKGTLDDRKSPVETFSGIDEHNLIPTPELYNRFISGLDIHAIYAIYSGKYNKFNYQVGLRGEYSRYNAKSVGYGQADSDVAPYKDHYFSFFPSMFISYSLPNNNEVQVNYTRRISRPDGRQLNPFMNITDSTNISFGNPYLSPQYSNAFELNFIKNWDYHMLSFSGYYRTTDDVIQRIRFLDGDVMKTTFENVSQTISAGTEIVLKNRFFKILDLTTTVNLFYYKLDGFSYLPEGITSPVTGKAQEDFSWNARMIANVKLPASISLQLTGNYNARQIIAQGYRRSNYALDAGVRKSFLNRKLSLSVNVRDIFNSRKFNTITTGAGFEQISQNWFGGRTFGFTLTYNFGNMNENRNSNNRNNQQQRSNDSMMEEGFDM